MEKVLLEYFPADIVQLILEHSAASKLQYKFRVWQMRHVNLNSWPSLRCKLVANVSRKGFDTLTQNALVRREWRSEPYSWIASVDIDAIIKEIEEKLWIAL